MNVQCSVFLTGSSLGRKARGHRRAYGRRSGPATYSVPRSRSRPATSCAQRYHGPRYPVLWTKTEQQDTRDRQAPARTQPRETIHSRPRPSSLSPAQTPLPPPKCRHRPPLDTHYPQRQRRRTRPPRYRNRFSVQWGPQPRRGGLGGSAGPIAVWRHRSQISAGAPGEEPDP